MKNSQFSRFQSEKIHDCRAKVHKLYIVYLQSLMQMIATKATNTVMLVLYMELLQHLLQCMHKRRQPLYYVTVLLIVSSRAFILYEDRYIQHIYVEFLCFNCYRFTDKPLAGFEGPTKLLKTRYSISWKCSLGELRSGSWHLKICPDRCASLVGITKM